MFSISRQLLLEEKFDLPFLIFEENLEDSQIWSTVLRSSQNGVK